MEFQDANGAADYIKMSRVDLVGDSQQRGFAHGALLAEEIRTFTTVALDAYIMQTVNGMDTSSLPEKVQSLIEKAKKIGGGKVAPKLFREAMGLVWDNEVEFAPANLLTELDATAEGMCSVLEEW